MNNLNVPEKKIQRVSLSEPASAPPGHKVLATAMEIGLVRDIVDKSIGFHETLLGNKSLVGKVYTFGLSSINQGVAVAAEVRKVSNKVFVGVMPTGVVQKTFDAHVVAWHRWVKVDESISSTVSDQLQHYPVLRKTPGEVVGDLERSVITTRIWKGSMMIFDSVSDFIFGLLHHEKHHDEESSDENKDVPEPFGSDVGEDAKKRRKKKSRGLTKGAGRDTNAEEEIPFIVES